MKYQIVIQPTALKILSTILDMRVRKKIAERIDALAENPEGQGKPLLGELSGYRSVRAVGERYRIVYQFVRSKILVMVVALGIRREGDREDVYELAKKLLRFRLIG